MTPNETLKKIMVGDLPRRGKSAGIEKNKVEVSTERGLRNKEKERYGIGDDKTKKAARQKEDGDHPE